MRPGLIGERCTAGEVSGVLVQWVHESVDSYGLILKDDGTIAFGASAKLRFPPTAEQPDELREAAEHLVHLLTMADVAGILHVDMPTREAIDKLQEAMQ